MKKLKSIAIDMDGVLADTETHFINWYEKEHGIRVPLESMIGVPEGQGFPDKEAVYRFLFTPGFFRSLPLMPGAVEALSRLNELYDIYIVSAAMEFPHSLPEKYEWLQEHFPFIHWRRIVFCGDKGLIKADYMIDDHIKNLDKFTGTTLLFNAAHNAHVTHHRRVNSWEEVLNLLGEEAPAELPEAC